MCNAHMMKDISIDREIRKLISSKKYGTESFYSGKKQKKESGRHNPHSAGSKYSKKGSYHSHGSHSYFSKYSEESRKPSQNSVDEKSLYTTFPPISLNDRSFSDNSASPEMSEKKPNFYGLLPRDTFSPSSHHHHPHSYGSYSSKSSKRYHDGDEVIYYPTYYSSKKTKKSSKSKKSSKGSNYSYSSKRSYSSKYSTFSPTHFACSRTETRKTDVIIIGAGYAGIRAAAVIKDTAPDIDVVILESSNNIGGRAKSKRFGDNMIVELGPKYLEENSTILQLFETYNMKTGRDDSFNMTVFGLSEDCFLGSIFLKNSRKLEQIESLLENVEKNESIDLNDKIKATRFLEELIKTKTVRNDCEIEELSQTKIAKYQNYWRDEVLPCVLQKANETWNNIDFVNINDPGLLIEYLNCGYNDTRPYEFMVKWLYHDLQYAEDNGSIFEISNPWEESTIYQFSIEGGASKTLQKYAEDNDIKPKFNHRVKKIRYDIKENNSKIRAEVEVETGGQGCIVYQSQRIISTVSSGVYNNDLIEFSPKLRYSDTFWNPMKVKQFFNVFYRFPSKFWERRAGKSHYIYTVRLENYNGISMAWSNLDREDLNPGSKTLMLTTSDDGFKMYFGHDVHDYEISELKLKTLLEPLKAVFVDEWKDPIEILYNRYHADENFGYGAYSSWEEGYTPYDFFKFWGAYDFNSYVGFCDHNGCNAPPGKNETEWILYLSGSGSCLLNWEWMEGAWSSGEMSAFLMMESLGIELHDWRQSNGCYPYVEEI